MVDQAEVHRMAHSEDISERREALHHLYNSFSILDDKKQAWKDLLALTKDGDSEVRRGAADALVSVFDDVTDKEQATKVLLALTKDEDSWVRSSAVDALVSVFDDVTDKEQATKVLLALTKDKDSWVRRKAANAFVSVFDHVTDKEQAWKDLFALTMNEDNEVRRKAANALVSVCDHVTDKEQAWKDLFALTMNEDNEVRRKAANALVSVYDHVTDKEQAWSDLIELTKSNDHYVQRKGVKNLGHVFPNVPNKKNAWIDLHNLIWTKCDLREPIAVVIGLVFTFIPDKEEAWEDLIWLTHDDNQYTRMCAADALLSASIEFPNKKQVWDDLNRLMEDVDTNVQRIAESVLRRVFSSSVDNIDDHLENIRLYTKDENRYVRRHKAINLGLKFENAWDKKRVWKDLVSLSEDEDVYVRVFANYSLAQASIYKAIEANNLIAFKNEFETALIFFQKAADEEICENPANFCLPFYRSFYTITFKGQDAKAEVERYITEAKQVMGSSESKEILLEAVEKLAEVLETARNARERGLEHQELLESCYNICNNVDQIMDENREKFPNFYDLYKKQKPSFDKTIKDLIAEVKDNTKAACIEAKGTPYENLACNLNKEAEKWEGIDNKDIIRVIERFIKIIKTNLPVEEAEYLCKELEMIKATKNTLHLLETIIDDCFILLSKADTPEKIASIQKELVEVKEKLSAIEKNTKIIIADIEQVIASIKEIKISLAPGIQQHIQVTVGLSGFGSGVQRVITIPINKISYQELQEDLGNYSGKLMDIKHLPKRLKDKIMGYIKEHEDELIEQT